MSTQLYVFEKPMPGMIGISGPRSIDGSEREIALRFLESEEMLSKHWMVGDATGIDALVIEVADSLMRDVVLFQKRDDLPYRARGAERSSRMVKELLKADGTLYAFVNKNPSADLKPSRSWPKNTNGSGTWGTIAMAVGLGIPVIPMMLTDNILYPDWLVDQAPSVEQWADRLR